MENVLSSNSASLIFIGMTHLGIKKGFNLEYSVSDKTAKLYLCIGIAENRVLINNTTPLSRQAQVLNAVDKLGRWAEEVEIWMVAERDGKIISTPTKQKYLTHVKPHFETLTVTGIAAAQPALTYPGNGLGRLLSSEINNKYYFVHGGKLETSRKMRGFDCTTFPMALLKISSLPSPGYGKQLCDAADAKKCGLEQIKTKELKTKFNENTISGGKYILFSEGHVLLYDSDLNNLHEFNFGGYKRTPAYQRDLKAKHDLWWMRKLDEEYNACFL